MAENNHVNSRLFKSILELINDFQNNYKKYSLVDLNKMILDIESLIISLENISYDLRNEMLQSWGMAEDVYSYAVTCNHNMVDKKWL